MLKKLIPPFLRLHLRVIWIRWRDRLSGDRYRFVSPGRNNRVDEREYQERFRIVQRINASRWAENKKHNLRLAIEHFQNLPIFPDEIFSFWRLVGHPSRGKGYKLGVNIIRGRLDFDYGGGLCQLSGLLYHLALEGGLEIIERHPHSVDLYNDATRYTPLGADATTAYGHKDLRLGNPLGFPVCFRFRIEGESMIGALCAPEPIKRYELRFEKRETDGREIVKTMRRGASGDFEPVCTQTYMISDHDQVI